MDVTDFLNSIYSDSALYMNFRQMPSFIDGLKNSGRKCLYTVKRKGNMAVSKVSNFAGAVIDESNYLHGNTSLEGALVTLAKGFCGSNNIPILEGVGSFGTRHIPEAAAARYIFIRPSKYLNYLFRKEDDPNLIEQEFEGSTIEPLYYIPTIPLLLVNGCEGIGVGFSNKVLPRSPSNIFKAIRAKLNGKKLPKESLVPSWKNFKGEVLPNQDSRKWTIKGKVTLKGKKLTIEELPMSFDLTGYLKELKKFKEKGLIEKFVDLSENDDFKFEVTLSSEESLKPLEEIYKDLELVETFTEILVCLDENNAIKEYKTVQEIFEDYFKIRLKYLAKRIKSEVKRLTEEEIELKETVKYIKEVIKGTINLKLKKAEVEKVLKEKSYKNIDKLLSMPMYSITKDKSEELEKKAKAKKEELEVMKKETPETLWLKDLTELEEVLKASKLYF